MKFWTFQNNFGFNLYIVSFTSYRVTIQKKILKDENRRKCVIINTRV